MKATFVRGWAALVVFLIFVSAGAAISRAQYDSPMPPPAQSAPAPNNSSKQVPAAKVNKAEEDAYKALIARTNSPAQTVQMGEDFVKKFPDSHYLSSVYGLLTTAYFSAGDEDKMFTAGTKALELNPDNVDVLSLLAMAMPRRVRSTTPDAAQQLQKAEAYARHAIELIPNLPKPPEVDQDTFDKAKNEKLSMAHSGLGLIDISHQKWEDARTELTQAVQLATTPDPVDYYLLGNADAQTSYYNDAVAAYDKCSSSGPLAAQCKAREETAKHDAATKLGR
jgi:tetratricopeptide (TPR) repeat protein